MIENYRTVITRFSRILKHQYSGKKKFFSVAASEIPLEKDIIPNESYNKNLQKLKEDNQLQLKNFCFKFPEFLPKPVVKNRNSIREKLERRDMLRRRNAINIPEFYVGSVLAVTSSDKHAKGKLIKFVGICIFRRDEGLNTVFILRNVIEHQGVEVQYSLYSPLIQHLEVLRLEKRLDENLFYLRDAPNEYSTFPFDMPKEYSSESKGVPVNTIQVPLNPKPWLEKYDRMDLKGAIVPGVPERVKKLEILSIEPWKKYDLMDEYRNTIVEEEQKDIFSEISEELNKLEKKGKLEKRKKVFNKPNKQKLF